MDARRHPRRKRFCGHKLSSWRWSGSAAHTDQLASTTKEKIRRIENVGVVLRSQPLRKSGDKRSWLRSKDEKKYR